MLPHFAPEVAWRAFLVITGLPVAYVWVIIRYLPESPRWIARYEDAERIVRWFERRLEAATDRRLPDAVVAAATMLAVSGPQPAPILAALGAVWRPQ